MRKFLSNTFMSNGKIHTPYIYIWICFHFLFIILSVRIASVFTAFKGELLSDTLIIALATQIIALCVSDAWHKRSKNGHCNGDHNG